MIRVVLFGAPGSGKGTQADLIEDRFGYKKISTGDLIRAEVATETTIGLKVKEILDRGELVSDEIIIQIVCNRVKQNDIFHGYTMDGFPRTLHQAMELSSIDVNREIAIFLNTDEATVIERLMGRLTCRNCGDIYNVKGKPPKKDGVCDTCSHNLITRDDDNEITIRKRFEVYRQQTEPVITYYRKNNSLHEINAGRAVNEIFSDIQGILK